MQYLVITSIQVYMFFVEHGWAIRGGSARGRAVLIGAQKLRFHESQAGSLGAMRRLQNRFNCSARGSGPAESGGSTGA